MQLNHMNRNFHFPMLNGKLEMGTIPFEKRLQKFLKMAISHDATVLLRGATGTGKSLLAEEIHKSSTRTKRPFICVNLASLHEGTLESELFGHERGSFTGAESKRGGRIEMAQGGTLFLDEIGELPLKFQARLLDFLQNKRVLSVGGNTYKELDVRLVLATHRNLEDMVKAGEFREDLYHRISILSFTMSSMIDRASCFNEILHEILENVAQQYGKRILRISPVVADFLEKYSWPGNFRELRNVLEYAVISCDHHEIDFSNLSDDFILRVQEEQNENRRLGTASSATSEYSLVTGCDGVLGSLGKGEGVKSISPNFVQEGVSLSFSQLSGGGEEGWIPDHLLNLPYEAARGSFERLYWHTCLKENGWKIRDTSRKKKISKDTLLRKIKIYRLSKGIN